MISKEKVNEIIFKCVDETNIEDGTNISKDLNIILMGTDSEIDSLGLVSLIVVIEEAINIEFDVSITLADEKAMSQRISPFKTLDTLSNYVTSLLNK
jgi:acyl carrier protein|tara:strand:+ start:98 stop:388 length:291 start_codon:yes stop_codon:yes gene_type:complete